jgi:hypothetical protein
MLWYVENFLLKAYLLMLILKAYLLMATLGFDRSQQQGARAGWLQRQKVCSQISFCGKEQLWVQM